MYCFSQTVHSTAFYGSKFTFSRAQIALKSYRNGRIVDTKRHLADLVSSFARKRLGFHRRLEAKIINCRLHVKSQYQRRIPKEGQQDAFMDVPFYFDVCCHMRVTSLESSGSVIWSDPMHALWCYKISDASPLLKACTGLRKCKHCSTECRLVLDSSRKDEHLLALSVYQDLGECISPFDLNWYSHFQDVVHAENFEYKQYIFQVCNFRIILFPCFDTFGGLITVSFNVSWGLRHLENTARLQILLD